MLRIRQLALVARDLQPVEDALRDVLGLQVGFNDPGVGAFGLKNDVLPVGDTFLEVVEPIESGTTAERFLDRQGGDAGYMVLLQTHDVDAARARAEALGVRVVWEIERDEVRAMHLHPRDVGGAIVSIDWMRDANDWVWAGPEWRRYVSQGPVRRICGAVLASCDPETVATRWSDLLDRPLMPTAHGPVIDLDDSRIAFTSEAPERPGERLAAIDVECSDRATVVAAAERHGLPRGDDYVDIGGTRFRLLESGTY